MEVPVTPAPSADTLHLLRSTVAPMLAEVYPQFAKAVFGIVMPREAGHPVFPEPDEVPMGQRLLDQPPSRMMTGEGVRG